jgi:chromosome segregation ATPase
MATALSAFDQFRDAALLSAANSVGSANNFLLDLKAQVQSMPTYVTPDVSQVLIDGELLWDAMFRLTAGAPNAPLVSNYNFDAITLPTSPTLADVTLPTVLNIPDLTLVEPTTTMPVAPTISVPAAPGNAPEFVAPATPVKPTFSLPVAPSFENIALPEVPAFEAPTLDATLPYDELTLTTSEFQYAEVEYESALLDETKRKLLYDLINGGYGIDTADEERLWQRSRERELRSFDAAFMDLQRQAAARGFALPPGAQVARIDAARQETNEKISALSRDIAVKRADMYVENRRFTLQQATQVEQILLGFHSAVMERALNAAKAQVELGAALYNARVARYGAQLDAFKSAAAVYESRVRGAMLAIEAYRTKVEGTRVAVEVQRTQAEVYRTQIQGVEALIGAYTSEVQAARALADIERVKLEAFKTTVDAYVAQVGGRDAEVRMYEAQLRGEQTKVNLYVAQVQAYAQRVDAYKSRTQAEAAVSAAQIQTNEALLSKYRAQLEGFRSEIVRTNAKLEGALRGYTADVQKYSAQSSATGKYYDLAIELQTANSKINSETTRLAISKAQVELEAILKLYQTRIDAMQSGAQVYGANAAAALSALNAVTAAIVQE